jgi:hypothetical protein
MKTYDYKIVVYEMDYVGDPVATFYTGAMTPQDAIMQIGDQLRAEEAS